VLYPALDVSGADGDLVLAVVDDYSPSAVDGHGNHLTIFFADSASRDRARDAIASSFSGATVSSREVDDEDWARRSQQNLQPITVGRIIVRPPWAPPPPAGPSTVDLVIAPSMGFGTGHHATTRLCLEALQQIPLANLRCLDVGTGSGVLALAARLLGAQSAHGIDVDSDAIQSAEENLALNAGVSSVSFETTDLRTLSDGREPFQFDVVTANLTGALLVQSRAILMAVVAAEGHLILSGVMAHEREEVQAAFGLLHLASVREEQEWVGLRFERSK
jgi:ribosomal protein L11 methyltransferase